MTSQNQFALLMESWTKGAVEKILVMLKESMSEAEDGPAVEQRVESNDKTKQTSMKSRAGRRVRPKKRKSGIERLFYAHTLALTFLYILNKVLYFC